MNHINMIFCDIDGTLKGYHSSFPPFCDEKCLQILHFITSKTDSKLVMTSSWKTSKGPTMDILNEFQKYHLDEHVIGCTPDLYHLTMKYAQKPDANMLKPYHLNTDDMRMFSNSNSPFLNFTPNKGLEIQSFLRSFHDKSFPEVTSNVAEYQKRFKNFQNSIQPNTQIGNIVILDDSANMGPLLPYLVHCDSQTGLTTDNAMEAIQKLIPKTHSFIEENRDER